MFTKTNWTRKVFEGHFSELTWLCFMNNIVLPYCFASLPEWFNHDNKNTKSTKAHSRMTNGLKKQSHFYKTTSLEGISEALVKDVLGST